jgi:hypothetical protein
MAALMSKPRRGAAAILALAIAWLAAGVAHAAEETDSASDQSVTVTSGPVGRITPGFLGLSLEVRGVEVYTGYDSNELNPVFEQLVRDLTPGQRPVLRLAGDSTDWCWAPITHAKQPLGVRCSLTPAWFATVKAFAKAVRAHLIVGVNLELDSAKVAAAEARAIIAGLGTQSLQALELGNEPDLYHVLAWFELHHVIYYGRPADWSFPGFLSNYAAIRRVLPHYPLAGPDIGVPGWIDGMGQFLSAEPAVRIATVHKYALGCFPQPATLAQLFSDAYTRQFTASLYPAVDAARAHGVPVRLDETNTISCGGQTGLSNTFAAALWSLDEMFELARSGFAGANVHTSQSTANQLFNFQRVKGVWQGEVSPEFYGLVAFAKAAPAGSTLMRVTGATTGQLHAWATRSTEGVTHVVLINFATNRGRTLVVRIRSAHRAAILERLSAPRALATGGVTLGGQSFGPRTTTGLLAGHVKASSVKLSDGGYEVSVPAASAAILTVP